MKDEPQLRAAGIITRGVGAVIDLCVVLVIMGAIYLGLVFVRLLYSPQTFTFPEPMVLLSAGAFVILSVVYLTVCWATTGRTVGSLAMGVRVITSTHRLIRWPLAAARAVLCVLFAFGLLWVAVDKRRRSLQDIVLRTEVVYDWRQDPDIVGT